MAAPPRPDHRPRPGRGGAGDPEPVLEPGPTCRVVRVVDGDTVVVQLDGRPTTIRLIGIDTPETVHPSKPVERYGKEASAFLRDLVGGQSVRLEYEPAMKRLDRYGRTLTYLRTVPGDKLVNLAIVEGGYGHAYTTYPFTLMERFRRAEHEAREARRGLWGDDPARPETRKPAGPAGQGASTVYITTSGSKYHRADCRYLRVPPRLLRKYALRSPSTRSTS
jgi:micrococcal nuclease